MRAVVERAPLLAALSRLMGVVERRNTIPILSNVCLSLEPGRVRLRATDLEMEAIEIVVAAVDEPGEITIPADKFHDIVRNSDVGCQVTISTSKADPRVVVQAGRSRFQLPAISAADFPTFEADGLSEQWAFPAKTLADMISRVGFIRGDMNPLTRLSATLLKVVGGEFHVVACSNAGIAVRREPAPAGAAIEALLLPKFTNQAIRWLADVEGDAYLSCSDTLVRVQAGGSTLTSKVLDDQYVAYERILLETQEHAAITDQDGLAVAIKRVMIMGEGKVGSVRLAFTDGEVSLAARGKDSGEGSDELAADYGGPAIDFLMNADILQGALTNLSGDAVELAFVEKFSERDNNTGKVIVRAPSDPAYVVNLMRSRA